MDVNQSPCLDSQQQELLREIFDQGGFGYVAQVVLAAKGDFKAAEAAHELAWEQLHSAPWHSVHPVWRDAYSLACLYWAAFLESAGKIEEALRVLDKGIIMGGRLLKGDLDSAMSALHRSASIDGFGNASCEGSVDGLYTESATADASASERNFAEVVSKLPTGSLKSRVVEKIALLTVEDFLCQFFIRGAPVIITSAMISWPALTKWRNLDYLKKVAGNRTVPVEIGEHYLASGWKQELMTMVELLERLQTPQCSPYLRAYLAQHPLFDQIPNLREDILIPDYCAASGGELQSINAWLGPIGTVTPLHHDPHHNLLSQVIGRKYVRLYSPHVSSGMYPFGESMLSNSSQVDLDNPDYEKFPLAKNLPFLDCVLEEGEMLYIPPKWWHYVRSLTSSFSVSFWWSSADEE